MGDKNMPQITIFTPTYNRAYCLHKCYESMKRQKNKDFIWLIIDDGSTDNTQLLVEQWKQNDNGFEIKYIYKENGGMHTGYNTAYKHINTELAMNVDSDDYLTDTAIDDILDFWNKNKRSDVGGIYALDIFDNGEVIGEPFPDDLKEFKGWGYKYIYYSSNGKKKVHKNRGDKKFIGVTDIIKQYPDIPVFEGEKYYSLYYKQHRIEADYSILIYNKPVCVVEYMEDGSSNNMFSQYVKNPKGFCDERKFVIDNSPSLYLCLNSSIHYVAESKIANNKNYLSEVKRKFPVILSIPAGNLLYWYIRKKVK